jgi:hypothetical protein
LIRKNSQATIIWKGFESELFPFAGIKDSNSNNSINSIIQNLNKYLNDELFRLGNAYYINSNIVIETISCDNYYYENDTLNKDLPSALELSLLAEHIIKLKKGETVEIPEYNFITQKRVYNKNKI